MYDVLVAGEINPDLILSGDVRPDFGQVEKLVDSADLTIGSSSVIFACGAAKLGLRVGFIGVVGDDIFGRFMLEAMEERGIDTSQVIVDPEEGTGLGVILNEGVDRAILTYAGAITALRSEALDDSLLNKYHHLHIASYFLQTQLRPGIPDIFRRARKLGLTTSLDTNWDPAEKWAGVEETLHSTSIFFPNENEGRSLTGLQEERAIASKLAESAEITAMKLGKRGALVVRDGEIFAAKAPSVEVTDTVGAGDSFDAGFVFGYLQGWPIEKTMKFAIACGTLSTQGVGGTSSQATASEAEAMVKTTYGE